MEILSTLLVTNEDAILQRLIHYANTHGYMQYTSILPEAWRVSVKELTATFTAALQKSEGIPPLHVEDDLEGDPISAFAVVTATRHRARGVSISRFLGLFKYFRQSYLDEILENGGERKNQYILWFNRFCDRVELSFCEEWMQIDQPGFIEELQQKSLELTNEKNLYLTLMESLSEPVFWVDESFTVQYANLAGVAMFGKNGSSVGRRNRDEIIGSTFPWLHAELTGVFSGQRTFYEAILPMEQDEGNLIFSVRIAPMRDVSGKFTGAAVIAEDVTSQHESLAALYESENRLRSFFESSNDGIAIHEMVYDQDGNPEDYILLEANNAYTTHTGIALDQVAGKPGSEIYKQNPPPFLDRFAAISRGKAPEKIEVYFDPLDRHYLIKTFSPGPNRFVTIFSDISERKQTEQQLNQAVETANSIMRAAPSAVGMVHSLGTREFGWVSDRMCLMTGYEREELIGESARILYTDQTEYERTGREFITQLKAGMVGSVETVWVSKSGEPIDVLLNYAPIDTTDHSQGIVFIGHDISEKKKYAQEQAMLETQLQRTQKLESLGVLAGGIAHDFNNILVSILGNADLALDELPLHSTARPYLLDVEKASRRAGDLCKQLLAYSGKGRFVIEPLSLRDVIEDMTNMLQVSIAKNAVLKYRFANQVPPVEADATQLRQVIMNLVINASEAIESRSGVISISTGAIECNEDYLNSTFLHQHLEPGLYSYIEVTDTGTGMDEETLEKLFEPFFTTKFSGRGLGMSAVLGIIRGHGGGIKVYSEPNVGTTIKILLPAALTDLEILGGIEQRQPMAWKGEGTVLLVDDEDTVLAMGKKFLERLGFDVITAENGKVAVEMYREQKDGIAAVLMDLTMPHLDGEGAFSQMKIINPDVRVLLSSGYNEQDISERFSGKGTSGFIQKPYLLAELREALKQLLG